ncbi:Ku protein [Alteromonas pelagimontana]|uniref:Non-homologous end joining protein Ku n=1 Tax=Alteromonas pelagimontana TaxID=1858656 RepID=A0A6M4MHK4_9ALTE|nr:Ku protein [Alteromonas pelagimontana]QJR81666.1 Ku protein [Alteromonas pelagimontana]
MALRAYWKGHIRLSLVSFEVRLHAAITATKKLSLHQYDKESGDRIHYQKVDESGNEVPKEDIIRGYEYEKGSHVPIDDDDLNNLKLESKHTIDLVQFTDINDVDPIYFEKSYYVVPQGEIAQEAFLTVREALKKAKKAAIGQVVLSGKERIVSLRPCGNGLIMDTLRYAYEVREAEKYFEDIPAKADVGKEQLSLAESLIEQKTKPFDPKAFKDHYQTGLMEIIEAKLEGHKATTKGKRSTAKNVVNIVDALKKSLEQSNKEKAKKTTKTTKSKAS